MALIINSAELYTLLEGDTLTEDQIHQAYNALDSAVTLTVHEALRARIQQSPHAALSYSFVRAMQGPAMDMMLRGVAINPQVRQDETERLGSIRTQAQALLDRLADAVWGPEVYVEVVRTKELISPLGKRGTPLSPRMVTRSERITRERPRGLNATSDKQCLAFFNIALGLPVEYEVRKTPQGTLRTPTANSRTLRKWANRRGKGPGVNPRDTSIPAINFAAPFVSLILTIRETDKMLQVLRTPLDSDGRMRCSYNVAGTENGRWSSSKNVRGSGGNLQNVTPEMRRMFCADDGHYFLSTDLEQAESRVVAGLVWATTGDDTYLLACESGDLHTIVARMTWPELGWTDDPQANRRIADRPSAELPKFSYRDISKRLGHGSNYRGSAYGIAQAVGIPATIVEDFQHRYFAAFPAIPQWHDSIKQQLRDYRYLDTPLGRRRWFFGRTEEDATLREAIAFGPQSTVGELLNYIMWRCWARSLTGDPFGLGLSHLPIQLLLQNHDAFAFQTPTHTDLPSLIAEISHEFSSASIPLTRGSERRELTIPGEFVVGFNWAYKDKGPDRDKWTFSDGNPDGLVKWAGAETRTRQRGAKPSLGDWLTRPMA